MPTLTITKQYDDGTVLTETQLDTAFASVTTFVNTTKLDSDNIQDGGLDADTLASSAVTTAKIAAGAVTLAKLAAEVTAVTLPPGMIAPYVATSAPTGWLLCDGSQVSRTTYAALYAVIGTKYGYGDNATTFHLPDFRGRFLRGYDNSAGRDPDAASRTAMNTGGSTGDAIGSIQAAAYASHTHTATDSGHTHTATDSGHTHGFALGNGDTGLAPPGTSQGNSVTTSTTSSGTANITVASSTANITNANSGGNETRPINANVNYIIKT